MQQGPLDLTKIKDGYLAKLKNKKLVFSAVLMGAGTSTIYLFASEAPFIGISYIGLTPDIYGLLNFIPPIGIIIGSAISNVFAGKKEPLTLILLGICIACVSAAAMLMLFIFEQITFWTLFLPIPFIYVGYTLVFSNSSTLALTYARNKANGSAMMNFINLGVCVFILLIVEAIASHQLLLMPVTFVSVFFLMFFIRKYLAYIVYKA